MTRLPENYEVATSEGSYTRFVEWDTKLRILTSPIMWYEYFTTENKPKRSKEKFKNTPDIKEKWQVKEFWAFVVYNYNTENVEICEITQSSIKKQLYQLSRDEDFGDPKQYDIKIKREWKGVDTRYMITPLNKTEFSKDVDIKNINLEAMYSWDNPFTEVVDEETLSF